MAYLGLPESRLLAGGRPPTLPPVSSQVFEGLVERARLRRQEGICRKEGIWVSV